ncbi:AraC family transcriptional regulator [Actinokineospora globicatena]|uniref:AraC family transcriptional regulator n=1 Tax=Actinokineospora globicatena TaxID=103729 RepID=A0A9W6QKK2_9PSEU|nr:AraC family transcriptional regulator [Actinokineospora globicatena]GLW92168.1 AraC family transcriptional regulator [Actinokineospora globicatena]
MRDGPGDVLAALLRQVRIGVARFGRVELGAPWGVRLAGRDTVGLHLVLDGDLWVDDVPIGVGDLVALHGAGHTLRNHPDADLVDEPAWPGGDDLTVYRRHGSGPDLTVLLCAELTVTGAARSLLLRALPPMVHLPSRLPHFAALLDALRDEIRERRPATEVVAARLVELVLLQVIRAELAKPAESGSWRAALVDERIGRALAAVYAEPARSWTVAGLAKVAGMSRAAFAPRFRELVGEGPGAHLTRWRMDLAAALLLERPEWSVAQVAAQVGYGSEFAFSTAFRRVTGLPPGRYRNTRLPEDAVQM